MCSTDIFLGLLALLFPPLPVWVKCGICSADSIINILLCMLGYLPGTIHAWYIIAKFPEPEWDYQAPHDSEGGRVYVFVQDGSQPRPQRQQQPKPPRPENGMSYGTAGAPSSAPPGPSHPVPPQAHNDAGEGSSEAPPPTYAQVIAGDHKVQSQD